MNSSSPQPTQDTDDLSDEQIARALQMDEEMEVGCFFIVIVIIFDISLGCRLLDKTCSFST